MDRKEDVIYFKSQYLKEVWQEMDGNNGNKIQYPWPKVYFILLCNVQCRVTCTLFASALWEKTQFPFSECALHVLRVKLHEIANAEDQKWVLKWHLKLQLVTYGDQQETRVSAGLENVLSPSLRHLRSLQWVAVEKNISQSSFSLHSVPIQSQVVVASSSRPQLCGDQLKMFQKSYRLLCCRLLPN